MPEEKVTSERPLQASHSLNDHLQGLAQKYRLVVEEIKVQLVAEEGGGLQQPVKLLLHHLILLLGHLGEQSVIQ